MGHRLLALVTPASLATMATVVAVWAGAHFFGAGEVADVVMLVVGYAALGGSALEAGRHFVSFAIKTKRAAAPGDLDVAAKELAAGISIVGVDGALALLFRNRPAGTFKSELRPEKPLLPYSKMFARPLPRNGGWSYKPVITFTKKELAGYGKTLPTGDVVIGRDWYPGGDVKVADVAKQVRKAVIHERFHQFLAAKFYFLREPRMYLHMGAYKRSFLLRYLEEAVAETRANLLVEGVGKGQVLAGLKFPLGNRYMLSVVQLGAEARGILLGPITVGGMVYQVYYGLEK